MQKQNFGTLKMGELRFDSQNSNVNIPEHVQVVSVKLKYQYVNGEATETVSKISLNVLDVNAVKVAASAGFSLEEMPMIYAEIDNPELVTMLKNQVEKLVDKQVTTNGSSLALRWIRTGDGGRWGGLKLILNKQSFAQPEAKQ